MSDIAELENEATDLLEEVWKKLEDSDYKFKDGSGEEESCKKLRDCKKRCENADRSNLARTLEYAAVDVEKRMAEERMAESGD